MEAKRLPRFSEWKESKAPKPVTNGNLATSSRPSNGTKPSPNNVSPKDMSPGNPNSTPPSTAAAMTNGTSRTSRVGERGRDSTVRFMLNPDRDMAERNIVKEYLREEDEEEERARRR